MSLRKRKPMVPYQPTRLLCPACGKPIRLIDEPTVFRDGAYRHAVNCTAPLRRRPKA